MLTCLKDYRTHPASLEAALAIIIAVRSPRSLLALSAVKPLVVAYCPTAAKIYCAHQLYIQLAAYCSCQFRRCEDVLRAPTIFFDNIDAGAKMLRAQTIFFDNIDAGHILSRKLAR